jgi:hypothetical protein
MAGAQAMLKQLPALSRAEKLRSLEMVYKKTGILSPFFHLIFGKTS